VTADTGGQNGFADPLYARLLDFLQQKRRLGILLVKQPKVGVTGADAFIHIRIEGDTDAPRNDVLPYTMQIRRTTVPAR